MSVRATPASAVPAFTSASAPTAATARAALSVDPRHPNAHLLSSLIANATPAMAVRATATTAPLATAVSGSGGGVQAADMAAQLQVQMGMAAYYQQMQVMMVNYMTAMQQQQQQTERAVDAITHPTSLPSQQTQRLSPTQSTVNHSHQATTTTALNGYTSMSPSAAAVAAQQMSAALAHMAAAATGQPLTSQQQQQLLLAQHIQHQQQQQEQYQLLMANPAVLAQFATPLQSTQPTQPTTAQPPHSSQPAHPTATGKQPTSAPNSPSTAAADSSFDVSGDMSDGVVRCVCGGYQRSGRLLSCSGCGVLQHRNCIGRTSVGGIGGKGGSSSGAAEYYCELCEPTAPVHVGRELAMQRKEREWKSKLRGGGSSGGSSRRKRRREGGSGEEGVSGVRGGGGVVEVAVVVDEDDEMKRLTEMFRAEIDNGLFESDTEKERAADCQPQQQQADYYQWNETEQVKVEAELKQEISNAVRHAAQHKADEHNNTNKAADDEERKEAPTAPLLLPLPLHTPRHHRTMTDSEKDAAAAISLLSPRPPLAPLTASSVRASPPSTTVSSIRSSPARSRFVFPTDGLLALSPHRSTSSPHSAATAASSYSSSSSASSASTTCHSTSRLFDQLLRPSPFVSSPTAVRHSSGRGSLSVPSSPISGRGTSVLFSTRQAGLIGRSPRAVLLSSNGEAGSGLLLGEKRAVKVEE